MNYQKRVDELRAELDAERISYSELAEIEDIADILGVEVSPEMSAHDVLDAIEQKLKEDLAK